MLTLEQRIKAAKMVARNEPWAVRNNKDEATRLLTIAAYLARPETSDGNSERLRSSALTSAIGVTFFDMYWWDSTEAETLATTLVEQGYLLLRDNVGVLVGAPREAEVRDICDLANMYEWSVRPHEGFRVSWMISEDIADIIARTAAPGSAMATARGVRAVLPTVNIDPKLMPAITLVVNQVQNSRPNDTSK
jgi:hypothetical protein